jgi:hypothetical protein
VNFRGKLSKTGPRKLLALDGGGIRGMITIEVLARLEEQLRVQFNQNASFVLADYFDYIAGTSTGAIIATCLSMGMSAAQVREFYEANGIEMFDKARLWELYRFKFRDDKLAAKLREVLGADTTLGTEKLKTLLMMVLRNATTDSPWPVSNNPAAKYNRFDHSGCNLKLPLWQLVRASTAAPTFFPPETVQIGPHEFVFVDGGVTMFNNPAFQLLLMATVEPYNLRWPTGEEKMLLVSLGTGTSAAANAGLRGEQLSLLYNVSSIPGALMTAALHEQDFLCRVFGKCVAGDKLDSEIGDMIGKAGPAGSKLFTYVRYNADLSLAGLTRLGLPHIQPQDVQRLDSVDHMKDLQEVGRAVAELNVRPEHFASFAP